MHKDLNMNSKIKAFGCSYTKYIYPTYADILGLDNQGVPGGGNERTFYFIMEDIKNGSLTETDTPVVQWSTPYRFDYLTPGGWTIADGNITTSVQNYKIWNAIKSWYNPTYEEEKTKNYKYIIEKFLPNAIFLNLEDMKKDYLGDYEFIQGITWDDDMIDDHPTVEQHISIAKDIGNRLGIDIPKYNLSQAKKVHQKIRLEKVFCDYIL